MSTVTVAWTVVESVHTSTAWLAALLTFPAKYQPTSRLPNAAKDQKSPTRMPAKALKISAPSSSQSSQFTANTPCKTQSPYDIQCST